MDMQRIIKDQQYIIKSQEKDINNCYIGEIIISLKKVLVFI